MLLGSSPKTCNYHRAHSILKAQRIVEEYDQTIAALVENPLIFRQRENGWRVYAFQSGPYLLFYRELPSMWIVAGLFHAMRSPDWLHDELAKLASRLK